MAERFWPRGKLVLLFGIVFCYLALAGVFLMLVRSGMVARLAPTPVEAAGNDTVVETGVENVSVRLRAAEAFFDKNLARADGHVNLYWLGPMNNATKGANDTNSEAVSYALLWYAQARDKAAFDKELFYIESVMLHPVQGYLMWRLNDQDEAQGDGVNIASDADLRAIKALLIAEAAWNDSRYTKRIDGLARGLETTAITEDKLLAPYGGVSGTKPWTANESWLSYSDFTVFEELASRRGEPWTTVEANMKHAVLGAQLVNGLYNPQLTPARAYGNDIDGSGYGINSMWIMVRAAQSSDQQLRSSALRSLEFYKQQFQLNTEIYALYDSNGDALSPTDTPWAYALVAQAAVALGDEAFADQMVAKLLEHQPSDCASPVYGAFSEGEGTSLRVGQFTMQESILALQDYLRSKEDASYMGAVKAATCANTTSLSTRAP
jgi:hypothetical protein